MPFVLLDIHKGLLDLNQQLFKCLLDRLRHPPSHVILSISGDLPNLDLKTLGFFNRHLKLLRNGLRHGSHLAAGSA